MGFSFSKLFGSKTSETQLKPQDNVETIINDVENKPFGVSEYNVLYAGLNELGGYYFFQTVIVGQLFVKSKTGAQLTFIGDHFELELVADMLEFESESSDIKDRNITKVDFQIEEKDIAALENASLTGIKLKVKKEDILFSKYLVNDEEE